MPSQLKCPKELPVPLEASEAAHQRDERVAQLGSA